MKTKVVITNSHKRIILTAETDVDRLALLQLKESTIVDVRCEDEWITGVQRYAPKSMSLLFKEMSEC